MSALAPMADVWATHLSQHPGSLDPRLSYTIHPSSCASSLASFNGLATKSANVIGGTFSGWGQLGRIEPQWLAVPVDLYGEDAPRPLTSKVTLTVPAFSKVRVPEKISPSFNGLFKSSNMRW